MLNIRLFIVLLLSLFLLVDYKNKLKVFWCLFDIFHREMYQRKEYPLVKNLSYILEELTYIFFPLAI